MPGGRGRSEEGPGSGASGPAVPAPSVPGDLRRLRFDLGTRPFLVLLELTRACDLACSHCRAEARTEPDPGELSTDEVHDVLDDLGALGPPRTLLVLTGGDPLRRADLDDLVAHAAGRGLAVAVSPAGTPRADRARLAELRRAGTGAVSFSLDGAHATAHDAFRRVPGSFAWTTAACRAARAVGLRLQVNTTVSAETVGELPGLCRLVAELGANLWSVFFLVPVGRGRSCSPLSADQTEDVLAFLHDVAALVPLKTTEAPAFRRVVRQRAEGREATTGRLYEALHRQLARTWPEAARHVRGAASTPGAGGASPGGAPLSGRAGRRRSPLAVGDGRGVVFVSHTGDVQPSGFLPLVVGNVRQEPLTSIYARSALLRDLRDPAALSGRCGRCELREVCGGSRAQAFARGGDPLGEDPSCSYQVPEGPGADRHAGHRFAGPAAVLR